MKLAVLPLGSPNFPIEHYLKRHYVSIILILICIFLFLGFTLDSSRGSVASFSKWGAPSSHEIRDGKIWGLVSPGFLEPNPLLLLFAIGWIWSLGRFIEARVSALSYVLLIISSTVFTTLMLMAVFGETAYGFGALTCSMFGYCWVRSISDPSWRLRPETGIRLILWVAICFTFNYFNLVRIAYGAFFFGFVWGSFTAYYQSIRFKVARIALPIVVMVLCSVPIFWAPWNAEWLLYKAYQYHTAQDFERAKSYYVRTLERDPQNESARKNLQALRLHELYAEADKLRVARKYDQARSLYHQILESDPSYNDAKEGLEKLRLDELYVEADKLRVACKFDEAQKLYQEILGSDPNHNGAKEGLEKLHLDQLYIEADKLRVARKFDEAQKLYQEILESDPNHSGAKEGLEILRIDEKKYSAYQLWRNGKYDKARQICVNVLSTNPNDSWAMDCNHRLKHSGF